MGSQSEAALLLGLLISLTASSFCVALLANNYSSNPPCPMGSDCGPINLNFGSIPTPGTVSGQYFTNTSGYNPNITLQGGGGYFFGVDGEWTQGSTGYVLTGAPGLLDGDPILKIKGVQPQDGKYTVNYLIDNSPSGDFYITPRYLGAGHTAHDIRITIKSDGYHIAKYPDSFIFASDLFFIPSTGAQSTIGGGSTFTTVLDQNSNTLTLYKDGGEVFTQTGMPPQYPAENSQQGVFYGGVGSRSVGFTVIAIPDTVILNLDPTVENTYWLNNFWDGLLNWTDKMIPGLGAMIEMLTLIGRVIVWTLPDAILPLWLNVILIKTQLVAVIYLGARLARGGG